MRKTRTESWNPDIKTEFNNIKKCIEELSRKSTKCIELQNASVILSLPPSLPPEEATAQECPSVCFFSNNLCICAVSDDVNDNLLVDEKAFPETLSIKC